MQHFEEDAVGKRVVDARGDELGRITAVQDGNAVLKPYTGTEASMDASVDPEDERLDVRPEQVVAVEDDFVRVELD